MGKKFIVLCLSFASFSAMAETLLYDYKQLGFDQPPGDLADSPMGSRFSGSSIFTCYDVKHKFVFEMSVGVPFKRDRSAKTIEAQYQTKYKTAFNWDEHKDYVHVDLYRDDSKGGYKSKYFSVGKPLYDAEELNKYMKIELIDGKTVEFTRFGGIPEEPYNTKKKLKPFFYLQFTGEPRYECGVYPQED